MDETCNGSTSRAVRQESVSITVSVQFDFRSVYYERSNLLLIARLVLRSFLDESMRLRHRIIETEIRSLTDLFVILEKVLWHGFKSSVQKTMIALRAPDSELWSCLGKIASVTSDMNESYQCIDRLDTITYAATFLKVESVYQKLK
uniref:Uncharacterized protein n=1 Tax=Setaria digitata TaxID=48799 RepID=A0A915PUZ8_9BILA